MRRWWILLLALWLLRAAADLTIFYLEGGLV